MLFSRTTATSSIVTGAIAPFLAFAGFAYAQDGPRSFVASPDVYKIVAQNDQYLVIEATWAPGKRDEFHSHPVGAVYWLTACKTRNSAPDGRSRESEIRAGMSFIVQEPVASHSVQNIGESECKMVLFEQK